MKQQIPLYDRRRLEALVMAHKMRVHLRGKSHNGTSGVKAPR